MFEPWQISEFFETPRRLDSLGHVADEEGHRLLRSQMPGSAVPDFDGFVGRVPVARDSVLVFCRILHYERGRL